MHRRLVLRMHGMVLPLRLARSLLEHPVGGSRIRVAIAASGVVVVAAVVIVVAAGSSGPVSTVRERGGDFAAWNWSGRVTSVQAAWRVPRILARSPQGVASTWIGAQGFGRQRAFIQIGVDEEFVKSGTRARTAVYRAWWSDTVHHYLPQYLFEVAPGDRIFASLVLADGQWSPTLNDETSGASANFSTHQETRGPFSVAEWAQEHAMGSHGDGYPRLSTVTFTNLTVDAAAPRPSKMYSLSMSSTGRGLIAPSRLRRDSFSIGQPATG